MYQQVSTPGSPLAASASSSDLFPVSQMFTSGLHQGASNRIIGGGKRNTSVYRNVVERGFRNELTNAEKYIQLFIRTYVSDNFVLSQSVWLEITLP